MRPKKRITILVSITGGCLVMNHDDFEDLRKKLPRNQLGRRGDLFGVPVYTLKTTFEIAKLKIPANVNGANREAMAL